MQATIVEKTRAFLIKPFFLISITVLLF